MHNLQTYKERMLYLIENHFQGGSSAGHTEALLFQMLNTAFLEIQDKLGWGRKRFRSSNLVSGTSAYNFPSDIMGHQVTNVQVDDSSGSGKNTLKGISHAQAKELFDLENLENGTPVFWTPSEADQTKYLILPPPNYSATSGITLNYVYRMLPLHRIYNQTAITASITRANATVTLSATPSAALMKAGDDFGIVRSTQSDGSAVTGESPIRWYRIVTIATAVVTLAELMEEDTDGTATFRSAQVHQLEQAYPGRLRFAPADLAVANEFHGSAPQVADRLRAQALSIINGLDEDELDISVLTRRPSAHTNFLNP